MNPNTEVLCELSVVAKTLSSYTGYLVASVLPSRIAIDVVLVEVVA